MLYDSHPLRSAGHARQLSKDLGLEKSAPSNKSNKPGHGKPKPSKPKSSKSKSGKNAVETSARGKGKPKASKGNPSKKPRSLRKSKGVPAPATVGDGPAGPSPSSGSGGKRRRKAAWAAMVNQVDWNYRDGFWKQHDHISCMIDLYDMTWLFI